LMGPGDKAGRTQPKLRPGEKVFSTWLGRSSVGKRDVSTAITITDQRLLISTINGVGVKTWTQFPYVNCVGFDGVNGRADQCDLSLSCDGQRITLLGPQAELQQLLDAVLDAICEYTPLPD